MLNVTLDDNIIVLFFVFKVSAPLECYLNSPNFIILVLFGSV